MSLERESQKKTPKKPTSVLGGTYPPHPLASLPLISKLTGRAAVKFIRWKPTHHTSLVQESKYRKPTDIHLLPQCYLVSKWAFYVLRALRFFCFSSGTDLLLFHTFHVQFHYEQRLSLHCNSQWKLEVQYGPRRGLFLLVWSHWSLGDGRYMIFNLAPINGLLLIRHRTAWGR